MGWEVINAKSTTRSYAPKIRLKDGYVYFNVASYGLIEKSKEDKGAYVLFLYNDDSKMYYVSQADKATPGAIRIPKKSKATKADLLEESIRAKFGPSVTQFMVDKQPINRKGYNTYMLQPVKNG